MAWTSPRTWSTSEVVTATHMNTHVRDNFDALNPLDSVGATSWAPNLEAATTDPNNGQITTTGRYWRVGPMVYVEATFQFGAGFSNPTGDAGSGSYFVTLPIASSGLSVSANGFAGQAVGSWHGRDDSSVGNSRAGSVQLAASGEVRFNIAAGGAVTEAAPFAWAANDVLSFCAYYAAA